MTRVSFHIRLPLIQRDASGDFLILTRIEHEVLWISKLLVHITAYSLRFIMILTKRRKEENSINCSSLNSAAAVLHGPKSQTWFQTFCPCLS